MDLVNEYLRAVAGLLPKAQREDIVAELRDTILTRIEEREGELDRPLTDAEVEAVLREVGHPVVVAARYGEGPQHVVGPRLYPYWLFAVKAAITLQIAAAVVVVIVRTLVVGNFPEVLGQAIGSAVTGTLVLIGAATLTAWIMERRGARIDYLDTWRVRDLRLLEIATWDFRTPREWLSARQARRAGGDSNANLGQQIEPVARGLALVVLGTALILWWIGVLSPGLNITADDLRSLGISPGALATFQWTAFKAGIFWFVLLYMAAFVLQGALVLALPGVRQLQGAVEATRGAMLLAFCAWLRAASPLAPLLNINSVADFIQRVSMLAQSPPVPLEPIVVIFVVSMAVSGLFLLLRGVWTLAVGGPRDGRTQAPKASEPAA